jgi:hypothetical protein
MRKEIQAKREREREKIKREGKWQQAFPTRTLKAYFPIA